MKRYDYWRVIKGVIGLVSSIIASVITWKFILAGEANSLALLTVPMSFYAIILLMDLVIQSNDSNL